MSLWSFRKLVLEHPPEVREGAAQALDRAAAWLEEHRWIQGCSAVSSGGTEIRYVHDLIYNNSYPGSLSIDGCCAAGAIALQVQKGSIQTYDVALDATCVANDVDALARWNDLSGRTKEEVVFALRAGADWLRAHEGGPQQ